MFKAITFFPAVHSNLKDKRMTSLLLISIWLYSLTWFKWNEKCHTSKSRYQHQRYNQIDQIKQWTSFDCYCIGNINIWFWTTNVFNNISTSCHVYQSPFSIWCIFTKISQRCYKTEYTFLIASWYKLQSKIMEKLFGFIKESHEVCGY